MCLSKATSDPEINYQVCHKVLAAGDIAGYLEVFAS